MAKFCGKCGGKLDETGLCPNCQANAPAQPPKEPPKADDKQGKKPGKKKTLTIIIAAAVLVLIIVAAVLIIPKLIGGGKDPDSTLPGIDADAYYEENSYVLEVIDAKDSEDVPTEKNAVTLLTERGFDQYPIEAEFNMDGDYYDAMEISDGSEDRHPIYYTYYVNSSEELWMIYVINGSVMATPVSFNLQSSLGVEMTFSESEEITSYDCETNKFYVTIPNETALIVKVVDRIDADTLEWFTIWEIENYD